MLVKMGTISNTAGMVADVFLRKHYSLRRKTDYLFIYYTGPFYIAHPEEL